MNAAVAYVAVRCRWCGVVLAEVTPPAQVRARCGRCKLTSELAVTT